jgi:hypothetical protein
MSLIFPTKTPVGKLDVGDRCVNPPKSSVDYLTPQFKQTNNEVPKSARSNSSSDPSRERIHHNSA